MKIGPFNSISDIRNEMTWFGKWFYFPVLLPMIILTELAHRTMYKKEN